MQVSDLNNITVQNGLGLDGAAWLDPTEKPFRLYGILPPDGEHDYYHRMPQRIADSVNEGVSILNHHTAGGRIRFVTDSPYVAIVTRQSFVEPRTITMPKSATVGFDLYASENGGADLYRGTFIPPELGCEEGFESVVGFWNGSVKRLVTVNMPLYGGVNSVYIGLREDSLIEEAPDYGTEQPIVYYGSSITQGGNASRPGNSYQAILTRELDWHHINMGFSGSARAEETMREYLAQMDMKVFVLDYDHNAPDPEYLRATHEPIFKHMRAAKPEVPIVMLTRPKKYLEPHEEERLAIVRTTYENALKAGDKNVFFIPGPELFDVFSGNDGTVDNCHPNDFGFWCMAKGLYPLLGSLK